MGKLLVNRLFILTTRGRDDGAVVWWKMIVQSEQQHHLDLADYEHHPREFCQKATVRSEQILWLIVRKIIFPSRLSTYPSTVSISAGKKTCLSPTSNDRLAEIHLVPNFQIQNLFQKRLYRRTKFRSRRQSWKVLSLSRFRRREKFESRRGRLWESQLWKLSFQLDKTVH